jgi:hypothetical protein
MLSIIACPNPELIPAAAVPVSWGGSVEWISICPLTKPELNRQKANVEEKDDLFIVLAGW